MSSFVSAGPTVASTWQALSGCPISDEVLDWPPDLFALTNVILDHTQAYRFALCPLGEATWPPDRPDNWADAVEDAGRDWSGWVGNSDGAHVPELLAQQWKIFREQVDLPLEELAEGRDWGMCEALLTLHAIADEACAGLGLPSTQSSEQGVVYRARGRELLARTGSLARIHPQAVRVLPKVRTSPNGTALGAFSRYVCVHRPGAQVRWSKIPARHHGTDPQAEYANVLLLPWPMRVRESDFRPVEGSVRRTDEPYGYFEFAPAERLDLDLLDRTVLAARQEVSSVDVVVFPESAVDESEIEDLEAVLDRHGVTMLMSGVRQPAPEPGRLPGNWVHLGVSPVLEKRVAATGPSREQWFHVRQNKHHRWSLDDSQIYQYHLGGALHPHILWWEAMDVTRRVVQIVELGEELTLVCLVCEDLAQRDDVAEVVRSVGPTMVFTPLLDGPQLTSRWAARYASVLADDPGSAVATLSAYGMVQRCRPPGQSSSPVVGLWKDPVRGIREVPLEPGAHGVLLTICGERALRRTADGRKPIDNAIHYFDVSVHQIHATPEGSGSPAPPSNAPLPCPLEVEDLTVLTGWAQALAEALKHTSESVVGLLAEARAGATWRTELKIAQPSTQLSEAFGVVEDIVATSTPAGGVLTLDGLIGATSADCADESRLVTLVRRVLRSTAEQRRSRQD